MSKPQKKRTKKYHPKNSSVPWALMARLPLSEKHVASIRQEMTYSLMRLRLNEKKAVNDASYLTAMFGIAWQLARQMTEKEAIKAQVAGAADTLAGVIENGATMTPETYSLLADAVDTAIEVFKVSLGGEFEEARKNLLKKETVLSLRHSSSAWTTLALLPTSSSPANSLRNDPPLLSDHLKKNRG